MLKHLVLPFCVALGLSSCTWYDVLRTTAEVVECYPSDNIIEEKIEQALEDEFNVADGSIDLSFMSPEK